MQNLKLLFVRGMLSASILLQTNTRLKTWQKKGTNLYVPKVPETFCVLEPDIQQCQKKLELLLNLSYTENTTAATVTNQWNHSNYEHITTGGTLPYINWSNVGTVLTYQLIFSWTTRSKRLWMHCHIWKSIIQPDQPKEQLINRSLTLDGCSKITRQKSS